MAALTATPANASASWEQGALLADYQVGSAITDAPLKVVYVSDADGKVYLADANAALANARAVGVIVSLQNTYGELNAAADSWVSVCTFGPVYGYSGMAEGQYGWVGTTAGEIVDAAPTTAYQYIVGQSIKSDVFFVRPGATAPVSAA